MTICRLFGLGMVLIVLAIVVGTTVKSKEARDVMKFLGIVFGIGGYISLMVYLLANCKLN